ncbi:MAG: hypothetical protein IT458_07650 [Planctomycetes bacterium]|nr:hypothetical protein [Planctomycetota bacterium]
MHARTRWLGVGILVLASCGAPGAGHGGAATAAGAPAWRDPVVVLPDLLATPLVDGAGRVVFDPGGTAASDLGARALGRALALPLDPRDALRPVAPGQPHGGGAAAAAGGARALPAARGHAALLAALEALGYVRPAGATIGDAEAELFVFAADWRRDPAQLAQALGRHFAEARAVVTRRLLARAEHLRALAQPGTVERAVEIETRVARGIRFEVFGLGTGGLLAWHYLRHGGHEFPGDPRAAGSEWAGARDIARVWFVGTPRRGTVHALRALQEGLDLGGGRGRLGAAAVGTWPVLYALLPPPGDPAYADAAGGISAPDPFDVGLWDRNGLGLLAESADSGLADLLPTSETRADRRGRARTFLSAVLARAERVQRALDAPAAGSCPVPLIVVVGDAVPTASAVRVATRTSGLALGFPDEARFRAAGDGVVTVASARGFGAWPAPGPELLVVPADRAGAPGDPGFRDLLARRLLGR